MKRFKSTVLCISSLNSKKDPYPLQILPTVGEVDGLLPRDDLIALLGAPGSMPGKGNGLVYHYRLQGSDAGNHTASFIIWYDNAGEKPLAVDAGFHRYHVHADLLTALMTVQIEI